MKQLLLFMRRIVQSNLHHFGGACIFLHFASLFLSANWAFFKFGVAVFVRYQQLLKLPAAAGANRGCLALRRFVKNRTLFDNFFKGPRWVKGVYWAIHCQSSPQLQWSFPGWQRQPQFCGVFLCWRRGQAFGPTCRPAVLQCPEPLSPPRSNPFRSPHPA